MNLMNDIPINERTYLADAAHCGGIESLKTDVEVKGLPKFVGKHVLTILKEAVDQTTK